jgi:DNA polymerase-1
LLQGHDELLFESPPDEADAVSALGKREMKNVRRLEVPRFAGIGTGANWRHAK